MPDGTHFHPISEYVSREWLPWAYCRNEPACGDSARVDIAAVMARTGGMPSDEFRRGLKCGSPARPIISHQ
jgi:hypothetical protein